MLLHCAPSSFMLWTMVHNSYSETEHYMTWGLSLISAIGALSMAAVVITNWGLTTAEEHSSSLQDGTEADLLWFSLTCMGGGASENAPQFYRRISSTSHPALHSLIVASSFWLRRWAVCLQAALQRVVQSQVRWQFSDLWQFPTSAVTCNVSTFIHQTVRQTVHKYLQRSFFFFFQKKKQQQQWQRVR